MEKKREASVAVFSGVDSYCRPVSVAFRADGAAFYSISQRTNWGVRMSKWRPWDGNDQPDLGKALETGRVDWGFKTLHGGRCVGARLPARP